MSRVFTQAPKTATRTIDSGENASSQAFTGKTRQRGELKSSFSSFKEKVPSTSKLVTLKDLNNQESKKPGTKARNKRSKPRPKSNHKFAGRKIGRNTRMWDDQRPDNNRFTASSRVPSSSRRNPVVGFHGNGKQDDVKGEEDHPPASGPDGRDMHQPQGGYTRITPDSKKREQLQRQRSDELARLEAYKEKRKLGYVSEKPSPVGGSKISKEEVRRQQQREQENKKYEMIRKRQQWAEEKKKREEEEFAEKKAKAREQTEKNKQRERDRQRRLQAERRDWIETGGLVRFDVDNEGPASGFKQDGGNEEDFIVDEKSVSGLAAMFPLKSQQKIADMLKAARGDVNKVIDWLSD